MEKLKFNFEIKDDFLDVKRDLESNRVAKELINTLNITDKELSEHYELILEYLRVNKRCEICKGINDCDHSTKGYKFDIKRDMTNSLTDTLRICPFYEKYYAKKKNIVYTTFLESVLLDSTNKTFLKDNMRLLKNTNLLKLSNILKNKNGVGIYFNLNDSKLRKKLVVSLCDTLLENHQCSVIKFSSFLSDIKSQFNSYNPNNNLFEKVLTSEILIIDDLGGESISSWSRDEILLPLLDYRIQNELNTIICSEYSIEDLPTLYIKSKNDELKAEKIASKIKELINE